MKATPRTLSYVSGAELAPARLWLRSDGQLVDLTTLDVTLVIARPLGADAEVLLVKTAGFTKGAGAGTEPDGTPNLTVAWDAGELALPAWVYDLQIQARNAGGLDYIWDGTIEIRRGYTTT